MTVEAYAKVNLTLEVFGRREDGYHEIRSVVVPVGLADALKVEPSDDGTVSSDSPYGDLDLAVKAARALRPGPSFGARLGIGKRIPVGGGLGGGSADAAAALLALNDVWSLGMSPEALARVGAAVGSDVPALVLAQHYRRAVLMEGRGERVRLLGDGEPPWLEPVARGWLVLANPGVASSTAEVYGRAHPRAGAAPAKLPAGPCNDLQSAACGLHPEIGRAIADMRASGAENAMMSGSGATVFGCAADAASAEKIRSAMEMRGYEAWSVRTL